MLEQSNTPSEQDGHKIYVYLVKNSCPEALLHDARRPHRHVLLTRNRFRLLHGALDTLRDERERRSFVDPFLWDRMGDDEGGDAQEGSASPPVGDVERSPPRYKSPHLAVSLPKEISALQ